jgi:FixJ family two-component response regulator
VKDLTIVFVVADEPAIVRPLEAVLRWQGYAVNCFDSVENFLAQRDPNQVGCILIDLLAPRTDGSELFRWLQESGSLLSVVSMSGVISATTFAKPIDASTNPLEEPYELSTLLTMVADGVAGSLSRKAVRERRARK